jgi:hypothetical protein
LFFDNVDRGEWVVQFLRREDAVTKIAFSFCLLVFGRPTVGFLLALFFGAGESRCEYHLLQGKITW